MTHSRLHNPASLHPSIEPLSHSGRGTRERVNGDLGLDAGNTLRIRKTVRGMTQIGATEHTRPDLVAGAKRVTVSARSGNDSRLLDEPGTPNGGMWDSVGMGEAPKQNTLGPLLFATALFAGVFFLAKGGRH